MRNKEQKGDLSVQAIAGTHVVLLGMDLPELKCPGVLYSTRQHPIQGFTWSDFSAKPDHDYSYEVFALRGAPTSPQESEKVAVRIRTESEHGRTHHVHFNRGAAASQ